MYCKFCMNSIADGEKVCPYCGKKQDLPELPHHLPSGTVLQGKYAVGAAIGEGGFGITYVGKNTLLDMKVAIKEFFPNGFVRRDSLQSKTVTDLSTGGSNVFEKGKKRFLDEARMLGRFAREGSIVSVYDFFEENDTAYIVMEFVEGQTLKSYLDEHGKLTPEEALALLTPAMKALEKVHKSGLIHRDISPENIMLTDSGVKLLDFGAARDAGGEKSLSVMLKHGYAPIEQYSRKGQQGPWTDVYALCATVYRCITGVAPDESIDRLSFDEIKKPSQLGVKVDPTFENALMKGLAVRPEDRYTSVSELLAALEGKDQPAAAVIIPAAAGAAAGGAGSAPTDPDKTVYGGAEDKADPDNTVYGGEEEKADPDKTVFGDAEDKADPDKTVYGGVEEKADPDKTVFGGAPQYRPDPDKTVYGGEAYDPNDALQPDKPEKKKSKKGLIIALIAAVLVIAGVMIALFAAGVFNKTENKPADATDGEQTSVTAVQKGDIYTFGSYEQDNNTSNGTEAIEWIVLDVVDGKALLVSKYALDCKRYNETSTNVTWETCTLRRWLNGTFYNTAFGSAEKSKIVSTTLTNANNPTYGTNGGKSTTDKVFLLSIDEANRYFGSEEARRCAPTDYAIAQGVSTNTNYTTGGRVACWWWLRSPGYSSRYAADVSSGGSVNDRGFSVDNSTDAVRPAIWIDISG